MTSAESDNSDEDEDEDEGVKERVLKGKLEWDSSSITYWPHRPTLTYGRPTSTLHVCLSGTLSATQTNICIMHTCLPQACTNTTNKIPGKIIGVCCWRRGFEFFHLVIFNKTSPPTGQSQSYRMSRRLAELENITCVYIIIHLTSTNEAEKIYQSSTVFSLCVQNYVGVLLIKFNPKQS